MHLNCTMQARSCRLELTLTFAFAAFAIALLACACLLSPNAAYAGTLTSAHTVAAADAQGANSLTANGKIPIDAATVKVSNQVYNGKAKQPKVKVKLGTKTLVKGHDYTVEYKNNTKKGTALVAVFGAGNYTGAVPATFTIFGAKKGWQTIDGTKYYLKNKKGKTVKGWKTIKGKRYYFDRTTGAMLKGFTRIGNSWYLLDDVTGVAQNGWQEVGPAKQLFYFDPGTYAAAVGQVTIGKSQYWFSPAGVLMKKLIGSTWIDLAASHPNGHLFHQRQGNGVNCGATAFTVAVNIMLGSNQYPDNVAVWSSKQFKKDSVNHLGDKGKAWLKANGLSNLIDIYYIRGDIHKTKKLRKHLEQGHLVIMCSGSNSNWMLSDGSMMNDHPTGHWIVFYHYANGVYYANDSRHGSDKGAGCKYTEAQMQQWLNGRQKHAAIAMQYKI